MTQWHAWCARHPNAHAELRALLQLDSLPAAPGNMHGKSEAATQAIVRLEAPAKGCRLWRNNVGALMDERGIPVRYGLANDSKRLNEVLKSSDLVGWRREVITPDMVGTLVARTVLRECKPVGWRFTGDPHELAQLAWLVLGLEDGADACFATREGTL